eukprot:1176125-Prorocentrum_minimum.AAC.1
MSQLHAQPSINMLVPERQLVLKDPTEAPEEGMEARVALAKLSVLSHPFVQMLQTLDRCMDQVPDTHIVGRLRGSSNELANIWSQALETMAAAIQVQAQRDTHARATNTLISSVCLLFSQAYYNVCWACIRGGDPTVQLYQSYCPGPVARSWIGTRGGPTSSPDVRINRAMSKHPPPLDGVRHATVTAEKERTRKEQYQTELADKIMQNRQLQMDKCPNSPFINVPYVE